LILCEIKNRRIIAYLPTARLFSDELTDHSAEIVGMKDLKQFKQISAAKLALNSLIEVKTI
jgi:hypothetical protein